MTDEKPEPPNMRPYRNIRKIKYRPVAGNVDAGRKDAAKPVKEKPVAEKPVVETPAAEEKKPEVVATATLPPPSPWQPTAMPQPAPGGPFVPPPHVPVMAWWPGPSNPAPAQVLVIGLVVGLVAAVAVPDDTGIGWLIGGVTGVAAVLFHAGKPSIERALWLAAAVALLAVGTFRDAGWMFPLCVMGSMLFGAIAMGGGRTVRGLLFGAISVLLGGLRSIPWIARGFNKIGIRSTRALLSVGATLLLVLIFGSLLAGADKGFSDFLESLVPELDDEFGRMVFYGGVAAFGAVGACFLASAPPRLNEDVALSPGRLQPKDYALPVGALVVLFAGFIGTQIAVMFGGKDYVMRTAGVTFAEYARSGFWQLLWVTVLTLAVIAGVARFAAKQTAREQLWLRTLLGALAVLTLVIVASALSRMWFYQEAYGWTVLRLLVAATEIWLALVYVMVIVSGIRLRANWLPRAVLGTGVAFFLVVAFANPERIVADHNVTRFLETDKIDTHYLSTLSADAVPALVRLPEPQRYCTLRWIRDSLAVEDTWKEWNLSRTVARNSLEGVPVSTATCEPAYPYDR